MTDINRNDVAGADRALSEDELTAVAGGGAKAAAPASKPASGHLFEIDDFSFDVEQVLS